VSRSSKWSLPFRLSNQNPVHISHLPHVCYMSYPSHPSFNYPDNIWWREHMMFLIMLFSPTFCYISSLLGPNILLSILFPTGVAQSVSLIFCTQIFLLDNL
jgi:hypothetical protein